MVQKLGGKMKIEMAHGSGGKASAKLMEDVFAKHFTNEILDKMEDGALLNVSEQIVCSTDSFVVDPIIFPGGDIGKLAVCGTVNDLLMMGSKPKYLTCGFVLETGLEVEVLEKIVSSMAETAKEAGVVFVAGDTKVVEGKGGLIVNVTGIGTFVKEKGNRNISVSNCETGDIVILSGTLGDHHAAILSARMNIENEIISDCAVLSDITNSLLDNGINVKAMRDVTRGGLGTILNEVASSSDCGIIIDEESLPVAGAVQGFADILGLDPLYMGNEGKMIAIVSEEDGTKALELMKKTKNGVNAKIIGGIIEGNKTEAKVRIKTRLGAKRTVDVLVGEGLPRIC